MRRQRYSEPSLGLDVKFGPKAPPEISTMLLKVRNDPWNSPPEIDERLPEFASKLPMTPPATLITLPAQYLCESREQRRR